ncbi:hypothetical protein MIMGU_mgv11b013820mg [Erythranthe guttata]|uniref:Cathepsin propeptide inhibitor domain-containing protein n=1 Tax=Erythranthe guttata TaxID=4155 RepID=A0A022R990_ERYGU|nr:hypothetical protein MIMGU_mgv11b013820mg [Erythranthe guttata]
MILPLLFLFLNLSFLFYSSIARAPANHLSKHADYIDSIHGNQGRRLYSDNFQMSEKEYIAMLEKLAQGYMSNSDLEKAMKEFNGRCGNISRIYSYFHKLRRAEMFAEGNLKINLTNDN